MNDIVTKTKTKIQREREEKRQTPEIEGRYRDRGDKGTEQEA
jgi:hypothetical protein